MAQLRGCLYQGGMMDYGTALALLEASWGVKISVGEVWMLDDTGEPFSTIVVMVPHPEHVAELGGFDRLVVKSLDQAVAPLEVQYFAALMAFEECLLIHLEELHN
jgi:hypothetical protein